MSNETCACEMVLLCTPALSYAACSYTCAPGAFSRCLPGLSTTDAVEGPSTWRPECGELLPPASLPVGHSHSPRDQLEDTLLSSLALLPPSPFHLIVLQVISYHPGNRGPPETPSAFKNGSVGS